MNIFFRCLLLSILTIVAKTTFATPYCIMDAEIQEKVKLFTDRSLYISGESIYFSAVIFYANESDTLLNSRILYCEVLTPDGTILLKNKYRINASLVQGCIPIPEKTLTGYYYLRAYTKRMRDFGPLTYNYVAIKIVNPSSNEVLSIDLDRDTTDIKKSSFINEELTNIISVGIDKASYLPHDTIIVSYQQSDLLKAKVKNLCLSIVPQGTESKESFIPDANQAKKEEKVFYPETKGLSLAGRVTASSIPVVNKRVNLSIIGEGRDFMSVRTDNAGRFYFALPDYYGSRDIFICAEYSSVKDGKIWVDNDFCTAPIQLPSPEFSLSEKERAVALKLAINKQIGTCFLSSNHKDSSSTIQKSISFYGKPTTIIKIDKYIVLPTLEEYFNELPSNVRVKKRKGESYFVVSGIKEASFYDPLVLIDWVAVDEPAKVLALSPQSISHIEVVTEDYIKGGQTYGGIISIISKKGDFAGIDLPTTGIFINYIFLNPNLCTETGDSIKPQQPDFRNTVLWKPILNMDNKEFSRKSSFSDKGIKPGGSKNKGRVENIVTTAPDVPGIYSVVIKGITTNGELFSTTRNFSIK